MSEPAVTRKIDTFQLLLLPEINVTVLESRQSLVIVLGTAGHLLVCKWNRLEGLQGAWIPPLQTPLPRAVWRSALCTTRGFSGSLPNRNPNTNIQYLCHHTRVIHKQATNPQTQRNDQSQLKLLIKLTKISKGGRGGTFPRGWGYSGPWEKISFPHLLTDTKKQTSLGDLKSSHGRNFITF